MPTSGLSLEGAQGGEQVPPGALTRKRPPSPASSPAERWGADALALTADCSKSPDFDLGSLPPALRAGLLEHRKLILPSELITIPSLPSLLPPTRGKRGGYKKCLEKHMSQYPPILSCYILFAGVSLDLKAEF